MKQPNQINVVPVKCSALTDPVPACPQVVPSLALPALSTGFKSPPREAAAATEEPAVEPFLDTALVQQISLDKSKAAANSVVDGAQGWPEQINPSLEAVGVTLRPSSSPRRASNKLTGSQPHLLKLPLERTDHSGSGPSASRQSFATAPFPYLRMDGITCCGYDDAVASEIKTESRKAPSLGFGKGRDPQDGPSDMANEPFTVVINKRSRTSIGVDITKHENVRLKIKNMKKGLISEWNEQQTSERVCVREGDTIVAINGAKGDCEKLLQAIKAGGELRMTMLRGT